MINQYVGKVWLNQQTEEAEKLPPSFTYCAYRGQEVTRIQRESVCSFKLHFRNGTSEVVDRTTEVEVIPAPRGARDRE